MQLEAPQEVKTLLGEIVTSLKADLSASLIGVYLHGSLAMGCYNPRSSDIDFLVITKDKLTLEKRKELASTMLALNDKAPGKGLEMSVVTQTALSEMQYPMPFEFHFSSYWAGKFKDGEIDLSQERKDPDLAAHLTIVKARGVTLHGPPIDELFPDVPEQFYYTSIEADARDILSDMTSDPVYNVLNLCRVWAYKQDKIITSKQEGGEWALAHATYSQTHTIEKALKDYQSDKLSEWNDEKLKQFGTELAGILQIS